MKAITKTMQYALSLVLIASVMSAQARSLPDFTELAAENSPAVVNISTSQKPASAHRNMPKDFQMPDMPEGSPFNELFKHFFGEGLERFQERESQSLGSGFIISEDGYILTNHHVVEEADEIQVRMSDRTFYKAKVIGSDKGSDVAVIKIEAKNLPTVKIGESKDLKVGEWVLAIGSPFGFDHTVTAGIVSAKGRSLPNENYVPFIQTDVAINPGNSGGPLFNLDGEVIGINSQIYSRSGGFMGLSFAIPIELAMNVADQLREKGRVSRGYLGVLIQDVDRNLAESFGLDKPRGALVAKVMPNTPASEAGLKAGDIILEFDGHRLSRSSELPPLVGASSISGKSKVLIMRNGKEKRLNINIGELPAEEEEPKVIASEPPVDPNNIEKLGINVSIVPDELRDELQLSRPGGALITQIEDGPAQTSGLRKGDIIQMYNSEQVKGPAHLQKLVAQAADRRSVAVLVHRDSGPMFMALRLR